MLLHKPAVTVQRPLQDQLRKLEEHLIRIEAPREHVTYVGKLSYRWVVEGKIGHGSRGADLRLTRLAQEYNLILQITQVLASEGRVAPSKGHFVLVPPESIEIPFDLLQIHGPAVTPGTYEAARPVPGALFRKKATTDRETSVL